MQEKPPVLAYTQLQGSILDAPAMRCGRFLVAPFEVTLPHRCVLCNKAADLPLVHLRIPTAESFRFQVMRKTAHLHVGFCPRHKRIGAVANCLAVGFLILFIVSILTAFILDSTYPRPAWLVLVPVTGLALFILSLTCKVIADRGPRPVRVHTDHIYFTGICGDLLHSLPHYDHRPGEKRR